MFIDYAAHRFETQPGTLAHTLGGEKRFKDVRLHFGRDTWSIVADFDQYTIKLARRANVQFTLALHGIYGVIDQVGPNLIQFAAARAELRQRTVEIEFDRDALLEAVAEHEQGAFETLVDVHFLVGALVHVSVFLDCVDQIGDAAGRVFDLIEKRADGDGGRDASQESGPSLGRKLLVYAVKPGGFAACIDERGREFPCARDAVAQQARRDGLLAVAAFQGIH